MARCPFAIWDPSPNFTPGRPGSVLGTMEHSAVGTTAATRATLKRQAGSASVSAHFTIGLLEGELYQHVDTADQAWHAITCNGRYVGKEHVDNGDHADPVRTPWQYETSAKLNGWLATVHPTFIPSAETIRPHRTCVATACPSGLDVARIIAGGGVMTDAEWQAFLAEYAGTTKAIKTVLAQLAHADHPLKIVDGKLAVGEHVLNPEIRAALRQLERSDARVAKLMRATRPRRAAKPPTDDEVRAGHGRG